MPTHDNANAPEPQAGPSPSEATGADQWWESQLEARKQFKYPTVPDALRAYAAHETAALRARLQTLQEAGNDLADRLEVTDKKLREQEAELARLRKQMNDLCEHIVWMESHAKLRIKQTKWKESLNGFNQGRADAIEDLIRWADTELKIGVRAALSPNAGDSLK